jgi:hypothetical protein
MWVTVHFFLDPIRRRGVFGNEEAPSSNTETRISFVLKIPVDTTTPHVSPGE